MMAVELVLLVPGSVQLSLQVPAVAAVNLNTRAVSGLGTAGIASVTGHVVASSTQRQAILPRCRIIGNSRLAEGAGLDD